MDLKPIQPKLMFNWLHCREHTEWFSVILSKHFGEKVVEMEQS